MTRVDYLNNPSAPKANALVPAASAIVKDTTGKILLHRRSDSNTWSIPGGAMEIGESIRETIIREVEEETGLKVEIEYLTGVYSNPKHVIEYSDGEIRQEFSLCFACKIVRGKLQVSNESFEVAFFDPKDIEQIPMHESILTRIKDYLKHENQAIIA